MIKSDLPRDFPRFPIFGVIIKGIDMNNALSWNRENFIKEYYERVRKKYLDVPIGEDPILKAYRQFYWKIIKIDPTKQRPASEALVRRFIRRKNLPRINPVVDIFNAISAATGIAMCAYDFDKIQGELVLTLSTGKELFKGIGMPKPKSLATGQLIIKDKSAVVSLYPYRDADYTKITSNTVTMLLTADGVPGIPGYVLKSALDEATDCIIEHVGGSIKKVVRLET